MKRIGLFLGADHASGGMFQYNQAMLEAVCALPDDRYSVVAAHASAEWSPLLAARRCRTVLVNKGYAGRALWKIWSTLQLPVRAWRSLSPAVHPVARALLAEGCDLWIFPAQDTYGFQMPVPALAAIHDLMHRYEPQFPEVSARGMHRIREWSSRNTCVWARGVLVDSETGKQQVVESYGVQPDRVHILPYVAPAYLNGRTAPDGFMQRYRLPEKYLFYPAHFWEHKNHQRLITAIARLKPDLADLKLVLTGSPKNGYGAAMTLVRSLGLQEDIRVLGYVPDRDMPELYRRARALVMPTFFGPTNIPPLEAFAAGCPAAVSNVYGMPEQVGDAALLFDPRSVDDIAGCIRRLWLDDSLCAELARRGRARASAWGQEQFNGAVADIIDAVLR